MSKPVGVDGRHVGMDRRGFLRNSLLGVAALSLPAPLRGDPYAPLIRNSVLPGAPVRVRGIVRGDSGPLEGVRVTDGLNVVDTAADGSYELITMSDRDFVSISIPSGFEVPTNETGTARFYRRIQFDGPVGGEMDATFDLVRSGVSDENHTVLLLADIQAQTQWEMDRFHAESVPDVIATLRAAGDQQVFGVACGDIMYDRLELYSEYERGVKRIGAPFFQVVGNHDLDQSGLSDEASTQTFSRHFGPRYYSVDRGQVHYVVLDDVFWYGQGYMGYLDADQLAWLQADLSRLEDGVPVIVFTHIPVVSTTAERNGGTKPPLGNAIANRDALYRLLERFDAHVLTGHTHESEHRWSQGVHEHVSGTVCGAWWTGDICYDGTPNGYSVYEVRGEEVTWRYKATGRDEQHQLRTYARGADPTAPDEFVANVWDWDPEWNVVWYEGADRRGVMAGRIGRDPRSVREHLGPDLPTHRTWVDPVATRHLFYAPAPDSHAEIRVEATDRFGRTYSRVVPNPMTPTGS
jgi:predicted phosphodiesterase